ncbi:MAG TPA: type II toxin-antitoxin system RelE/ParE family toxin [Nannocystaceae bacterium]|nr:type II toxin-antitoxin system RelE/ParE family toxin [Nannocystaceae bacterium]
MKRPVLLRPEAEAELVEAWAWYEAQRAGLGEEFVACFEAVISIAARAPNAFPASVGEVRRALVRRFPYGVFYTLDGESLVVLAVAHARRRPGYWQGRIPDR